MSIYPIYIDSTTSGSQLSIGTVNASTILFGNVNSSTTVNGLFSVSNISINGNLAMGTGKNITLQPNTGYTNPLDATQLGYVFSGNAILSNTLSSNSRVQFSSISLTQKGTYTIFANVFLTMTTTAFTSFDMRISTDSTGTSPNTIASIYNTATQPSRTGEINNSLSGVYVNSSESTILYFTFIPTFTGTLSNQPQASYPSYFKAVRIA